MTTWRELKEQGIKRCCVMYSDGTRCRRRALVCEAGPSGGNWCAKHAPEMKMHTDFLLKVIGAEKEQP